MNEAKKIMNSKDDSLGFTVNIKDLSISQLSQIKTTCRSEKHWLKVSMFVFVDDSYIIVESNNI